MKRQSIEDRAHNLKGLLLAAGFVCFAVALTAAWASRFSIFWGFASAFGMTLAFALFTPSILSPFTHYGGIGLKRIFGSLAGFLAADHPSLVEPHQYCCGSACCGAFHDHRGGLDDLQLQEFGD